MNVSDIFLLLAIVSGVWALVSAILVAKALEPRGTRTSILFLGPLVFRNLNRYREVTRAETGKTGPLFYSYVVPINLAWIFALAAWGTRAL
ncbi:MAG: hypothetical protein IH621_16745 [Krumholzibacteria bacterium]|nr:hypothetical protein [Candidatus Krumholzibacteria bacterium]